MHRIAIVASALGALLTLPASAADMVRPVYKAPMVAPAPIYNWTGFYLGGNVGYGWGSHDATQRIVSGPGFVIVPLGTALYGGPQNFDLDPRGVIGGGQIGFNWQFAPAWVFGLEADIQASGMKRTANCVQTCNSATVIAPGVGPATFPVSFSENSAQHKIHWFGTVRGRVGLAAGSSLFYVTGGLAYAELERNASVAASTGFIGVPGLTVNTFSGSFNAKSTKTGWTLGGGMETALFGNWTLKAEYLYLDLGSVTETFNTVFQSLVVGGQVGQVGTVAEVRTITSDLKDHIVRVGLNYRFVAK